MIQTFINFCSFFGFILVFIYAKNLDSEIKELRRMFYYNLPFYDRFKNDQESTD